MKLTTYTIEIKEVNNYYDIDKLTLENGKYTNKQVLEIYTKRRLFQAEKGMREMFINAQIVPQTYTN